MDLCKCMRRLKICGTMHCFVFVLLLFLLSIQSLLYYVKWRVQSNWCVYWYCCVKFNKTKTFSLPLLNYDTNIFSGFHSLMFSFYTVFCHSTYILKTTLIYRLFPFDSYFSTFMHNINWKRHLLREHYKSITTCWNYHLKSKMVDKLSKTAIYKYQEKMPQVFNINVTIVVA